MGIYRQFKPMQTELIALRESNAKLTAELTVNRLESARLAGEFGKLTAELEEATTHMLISAMFVHSCAANHKDKTFDECDVPTCVIAKKLRAHARADVAEAMAEKERSWVAAIESLRQRCDAAEGLLREAQAFWQSWDSTLMEFGKSFPSKRIDAHLASIETKDELNGGK